MGKGAANCVHEQVAKADCECPLYGSNGQQKTDLRISQRYMSGGWR